ncbi:hypothetical protein [Roseomonas sp. HF4]|uniref:hypothetical protein n=1 Tax=Roseomonas sp. HF4 TaxID=2562313 RepID=UPI0010C07C5A|nr:hypothetical protein [Roseomonas sp. HF4]
MADASLFEAWSPVTQDFGLVRGDHAEVADAYAAMFAGEPPLRRRNLAGGLAEAFEALAPLTHAKSRRLFLATPCGWTAFFQNGTQGSDPFLIMLRLAQRLGTIAMRVCCTPTGARWPGVIWEVYAPPQLGGDAYGYRRSIAASNDGGRWVFSESGERFAFERPECYALARKRDRFTRPMLLDYLRAFGIPELDDDLFLVSPATPAILFHDATRDRRLPEYSLEEVKRGLPWQRGA